MSCNRTAVAPLDPTLRRGILALTCLLLLLGCAFGQDSASVPNLVKFSGTISSAPAGTVGVIFALYSDQTGGAPLWQEVQNVGVDAGGHYTSLLGSSTAAGIPLEVFSSNQARWLGVQVQGQPEQPRVLLVSVPYAMKAADAQTLGGLPPSAFLRADAATTAASSAAVPTAFINTSAVSTAARQAVAIVGVPVAGTLPVFADGAGNLTPSLVSQLTPATGGAGNFVGINTTSPVADLHILGVNPTLRMEQYGPVGDGDSPNFNFYSGNGTAASPTATLDQDNLGQFAATGFNGSAFGGSKVKVSFEAVGNWTPTANGTALSFQTTSSTDPNVHRTERMRIGDNGNVGIGDFSATPPPYPLTVNGIIDSTAGGILFPDGTTQTTAAVSGVSVTSPDTSITVAGTPSAPTVALNTSFTNALYAPVSGSANYAPASGSLNYAPASGSGNYVATTGSTMTGALSLPANGLQMANNQIVTSGGQLGYGAPPSVDTLVDIGGSYTAPTYEANLLRLDGTVNSSYYGQAYLRGLVVYPTFNLTQGYANYLTGVELSMPPKVGSNVAHSIVGFHVDGQPTGAGECSVAFGINVPNQQTSLCNGVYGFYQGGSAQYNYFASNVGIGTPFPSALLEVNGTAKFDGLVTFASGQTFPGASVSITSPNSSITVAGTASAPTVALNTSFTNALYAPLSGSANYVATTGSTMTGALSLPANGLQMANNQIVTSGGQLGYGAPPSVDTLVDIGGSYTAPTYEANLLRLDGTVNSSYYGQAYLRGLVVYPTFNLTQGYANYLTGVELSMPPKVGSNVAHSIVGFHVDGQPTGAGECSVAFGINVPNQQTSLCNGVYGFYQGGSAQYNYFASNVGIGTPFPTQALTVQGNVQVNGSLNATTIQTNGTAGAVATQGTPASSSAACTPPQLMYDSSYVYTCVATNTWRRAASAAF